MIPQATLRGLTIASFPISGPKTDPTPEDYALEAALLRQEGAAVARQQPSGHYRFCDLAKRFERIARRKSHSQRMKMKESA